MNRSRVISLAGICETIARDAYQEPVVQELERMVRYLEALRRLPHVDDVRDRIRAYINRTEEETAILLGMEESTEHMLKHLRGTPRALALSALNDLIIPSLNEARALRRSLAG